MSPNQTPHLTPENLIGKRFSKATFGDAKVALMGYCPPSSILSTYEMQQTHEQYFIHLNPASVKICQFDGIPFLSLFHVYGGPVSSATIEELAYYGIETMLVYGLAGGLGTKDLQLGDFYLVTSAHVADGTTGHYTDELVVYPDPDLSQWAKSLIPVREVQAYTCDTIYQEYNEELTQARSKGCDIINCDSTHLFAVSKKVGIRVAQMGVISDVIQGQGCSESVLSTMLAKGSASLNPLELTGNIVQQYIEQMLPELTFAGGAV